MVSRASTIRATSRATPIRARRTGAGARALALIAVLGIGVPGVAPALEAALERNPIHANETVRLIVSTEGRAGSERPDLDPLTRDFEVLGVSTSTQVRFENGRQSATTRWVVELAPRRTGTLTVPALALAGARSRPLTLEVLPARARGEPGAAELFLESEISPEEPYVQSQVRYVVRLLRALDLLEGASLTEPQPENAVVTRLGTDLAYTAERGGRRYRVLERRYAIFPQASGVLRVPPVEFVGEVVEPGQGGAFGGLFAQGRRVQLATEFAELTVRPRAPGAPGDTWLPASALALEEEWPADASPTVGEPVTRTVRIRAEGLRGDQLPALELAVPDGIRAYADQPTTTTGSDQQWIRGVREQRVALIPERPGSHTLPEIRVAWWDVGRDAPAWATVPARTVEVAPAPGSAAPPPATAIPEPAPSVAEPGADRTRLWQLAIAALAALWLVTALAWRRARGTGAPAATAAAPTRRDARVERTALRRACAAGDAEAARDALLAWAQASLPEPAPRSLGALARRLDDTALVEAIGALDRSLYAREDERWDAGALAALLPRLEAGAGPGRDPAPQALPPLYPPRT